MELTSEQKLRYARSLQLPDFDAQSQKALIGSSVLVVGCGALGSICAMYLAASGVGRIALCEFDNIDISNLQRQLSYTESDVGKPKIEVLSSRLNEINSQIKIEKYTGVLKREKAIELFKNYDVIVEGSDNPATKHMVSEVAYNSNRPCVLGGVSNFNGQVITILPGGIQYNEIFPDSDNNIGFTPCSIGGVFGPLPGIVGSIQAAEVIKVITGIGDTISDGMLLIDARTMTFRRIRL